MYIAIPYYSPNDIVASSLTLKELALLLKNVTNLEMIDIFVSPSKQPVLFNGKLLNAKTLVENIDNTSLWQAL